MSPEISTATPLEIASLWRLGFLSGDDVAAVCLLWLERDLNRGDSDIAAFADEKGLVLEEIAPAFERVLKSLNGRAMERTEAMLRALRWSLASAMAGDDLVLRVEQLIDRFRDLSENRLVRHPRRIQDRPDEVYAGQNLGLEYVYGGFYAFDDIAHLETKKRSGAERRLLSNLRQSVQELHTVLTAMLAE